MKCIWEKKNAAISIWACVYILFVLGLINAKQNNKAQL